MISAHPLISNSSSLLIKLLEIVSSAPITIGITVTFMFLSFFSSLARSKYLSLFLFSLFLPGWQNPLFGWFSHSYQLSLVLVFWLRLGDLFVSQNLRKFCVSFFLGRFCFVRIPFGRMVKFQFLAQFSVDHLPHPVISSLIFFLR